MPTPPCPPAERPSLLMRVMDGSWINPNKAHTDFATQFSHPLGTFGYPFHVATALLACLSMAGPVVLVELGAIPLLVCWLLRLPFVWRHLWTVIRQPVALCTVAWGLWLVLSIAWSPDRAAGWHEATFTRWLWFALALWPVLDRRGWLIAALCAGFACAHLAQAAEWVALRQGITLFWHPASPDPLARVSGWWQQPAAGGVMCAASLGLHIGPALMGTGWRRWSGLCGSLAAAAALLATGSRGSMIAAAALVLVVAAIAASRSLHSTAKPGRRPARAAVAGVLALIVIGASLWAITGPSVTRRIATARDELARISQNGDANSDIGARVIAARAAVEVFASSPVRGRGAGSFALSVAQFATDRAINLDGVRLEKLKTAHNTPLHALATTGLVGGGLLLASWACGLWGAGRGRIGVWSWIEDPGAYAASPLFALLALSFAAGFETIYLNMTMQALFSLLIALSPVVRPVAQAPRP